MSLALLPLLGCQSGDEQAFTFTRFAMDTVVEYTIVASNRAEARDAMMAAHEEIERVAGLLWEEHPESEIHRLNHSTGPVVVSPEVYDFLLRARGYSRMTGGAFDATIRPVLDLYDFEDDGAIPPDEELVAIRLQAVGSDRLRFEPDHVVDRGAARIAVGGVAKGYAVDRAVEVLRNRGVENALVNAGGDLYAMGLRDGRPWRIGIRHPDDPGEMVEVLEVSDAGVATSGDYQRYFIRAEVRYHHLLDPSTGRPARHVRSATVIAPTTEEADALASGLFVAGREGFDFLEAAGLRGITID